MVVKKADGQLFTQDETKYTQNSPSESEFCANCTFFDEGHMVDDIPSRCSIVENQPLAIVSGGLCTQWVAQTYAGKVKYIDKCVYLGGAIKSLDDKGRIGGYLIRYGDPNTVDLQGEYFTKDTELELDWYSKRPILFHHGGDPGVKGIAIGVIDKIKADDEGVWAEGILHLRQKYVRAIHRMVKEGILDWSVGTLPQLVEVAKDGFIKRWPIVEGSTTPTPAMPFNATRIHSIKGLVEASKGMIPELFKDASENGDSVFQTLFDKSTLKGFDMGTKMAPEQVAELRAVVEPMIREILDSMTGEKQGIEEEEEIEIAKQAMEEEAEDILEDEMKAEGGTEEEEDKDESSMKKSVEKIIFANVSNIALAGMQAIAEHRNGHSKTIGDGIQEATKKLGAGTVIYGRAKSNVGGAEGAYGTGNNPAQAPGQMGRAQKPGLASFIKSAANHDFGRGHGKAQNPYIGDAGGYLLGQELRQDILPPLRENVVAFDAGVRQTNVAQGIGTITQTKMTTAPTAFRPGINTAISDDEGNFDTITAFLRPIAAQVNIPFQLLEQSPLTVEQTLREEMIRSISLQIDSEILNGVGVVTGSNTGAGIRGIKTVLEGDTALAVSNIVTLATNGRKPTFDDANNAETQIAKGNVADTEPKAWIMHSRSRGRYRGLVATTGEPLFRDNYGIEAFPELIGYPVHVGNQIPITDTIGSTSDNSEIYFGAWRYVEYVMQDALEIIVDRITLANQLMARIIAYTYSDILIHYPEAFYVMKGVR